ncbi:MAG: phosphoribosyltransferase family protein [Capnocytophaga sp.]|nr:phosphoribosyltransferase family protein [Capnocytophaga sp.]
MRYLWKNILSTLFPKYCISCHEIMSQKEEFICISCRHFLEKTNFHEEKINKITEKFWGSFPLSCASALFYFQKEGVVQRLIHELKYYGKENIGQWLGKWYATELSQSPHYQNIDIVIPIPVHPKKLKTRGYNQVHLFAKEIANSLQAKLIEDVLVKTFNNSAQAQKNKEERYKDSKDLFSVQNKEKIIGKNILLVDDVITTGATLEVCAKAILAVPNTTLGICCIAFTEDFQ